MGVAIVKNDSVILIDAVHDFYGASYLPSDPEVLSKVWKKEKPFAKLIVVTATHIHGDHFDETMITSLSNVMRTAKTVVGKQLAEKLTGIHPENLLMIDRQGTVRLSNQLAITMKEVTHGPRNPDIENYRIEITWGTERFVHFGDAPGGNITFDGLKPGATVAIVPNWLCFDEKDISMLEAQQFKTIIATHIAPTASPTFGKCSIPIIGFRKYGDQYVVKP